MIWIFPIGKNIHLRDSQPCGGLSHKAGKSRNQGPALPASLSRIHCPPGCLMTVHCSPAEGAPGCGINSGGRGCRKRAATGFFLIAFITVGICGICDGITAPAPVSQVKKVCGRLSCPFPLYLPIKSNGSKLFYINRSYYFNVSSAKFLHLFLSSSVV